MKLIRCQRHVETQGILASNELSKGLVVRLAASDPGQVAQRVYPELAEIRKFACLNATLERDGIQSGEVEAEQAATLHCVERNLESKLVNESVFVQRDMGIAEAQRHPPLIDIQEQDGRGTTRVEWAERVSHEVLEQLHPVWFAVVDLAIVEDTFATSFPCLVFQGTGAVRPVVVAQGVFRFFIFLEQPNRDRIYSAVSCHQESLLKLRSQSRIRF
ncbi:hypothetical protein D3C79_716460 [compost metagenome]